MTVKEFLKTSTVLNISAIAKMMWPENADAQAYLNRKLSDNSTRPFTKKDAEKAIEALKELSITINGLTVE